MIFQIGTFWNYDTTIKKPKTFTKAFKYSVLHMYYIDDVKCQQLEIGNPETALF